MSHQLDELDPCSRVALVAGASRPGAWISARLPQSYLGDGKATRAALFTLVHRGCVEVRLRRGHVHYRRTQKGQRLAEALLQHDSFTWLATPGWERALIASTTANPKDSA